MVGSLVMSEYTTYVYVVKRKPLCDFGTLLLANNSKDLILASETLFSLSLLAHSSNGLFDFWWLHSLQHKTKL